MAREEEVGFRREEGDVILCLLLFVQCRGHGKPSKGLSNLLRSFYFFFRVRCSDPRKFSGNSSDELFNLQNNITEINKNN